MKLYLVRHAHAGQGKPDDPQDPLRPLSPKGRQQAKTLAAACKRLGITFDRLFSSPYTRAAQTAEPLLHSTKTGRLEPLSHLTTDAYEDLMTALRGALGPADGTVALVGHEPHLGELASFLLTGNAQIVAFRFRKSMIVELTGPLEAGKLELRSALTPGQLAALAL